jgi:ABC-type multidrug transport system ATPase subunit
MLSVREARKRYGAIVALDGVSFEVGGGSVLAVIGANGAGKTTLLKCVVGLLKFEGQVLIDGVDVARKGKDARRLVGYVPQQPALHGDLSVRETSTFYADLKGVPHARAREVVDWVGLADHVEKRADALSGGMRQRLALALAMLADPPLLVLDEPASGLDVSARLELRRLVQEQRKLGKAIILSTHWLEDVPYIADDALVLDQGKAVYQGLAKQLTASATVGSKLYLRLNGRSPEAVPVIEATAAAGAVDRSGDWLVVTCKAEDKAQIVEALFSAGIGILDFRVEEASVDEAVMDLQGAGRAAE